MTRFEPPMGCDRRVLGWTVAQRLTTEGLWTTHTQEIVMIRLHGSFSNGDDLEFAVTVLALLEVIGDVV